MKAGDSFRIRACGGDGSDRQGRGVGRKDASLADDGLERSKQRLLGIQALDDRFDRQVDPRELAQIGDDSNSRSRARGVVLGQLVLGGEHRQGRGDRAPRFRRGIGLDVVDRDVESRLRRDLCDAAPHQTSADDRYRARDFGHHLSPFACRHAAAIIQ